MPKNFICLLVLLLPIYLKAQTNTFPVAALQEDFRFIRQQLFNAHANPFSVLTKEQYTHYLDSMEARITAPLSAAEFLERAKPALAPLEDEHSALFLPETVKQHIIDDRKEDVSANISYTRYGRSGYLLARSFSCHGDKEMAIYEHNIDSIFHQIHLDGITRLVIDVSHNTGGNSGVGDIIINHIWNKPYIGYACNWRRSDEYLHLMKSWHSNDEVYEHTAVGDIVHFDPDTITPPESIKDRFNGKVIVLTGPKTFSSAIMFATLVKDNGIAQLAGQSPENGHPTHFGENYGVELPYTGIQLKFGVKEWIRPAGKTGVNKLIPDIPADVNLPPDQLIRKIKW
ncbi:S41 family peptidase [Chitinophaga vietnamensis]|uniref:S41 family peptidase n=1 Tax=Chitinophaga vietnamensis TaxID=2593957 RepID=UPI0011784703|nr:S41 family peptidase [Chitinophaga vietnamensis]